ncbi:MULTISPECIES: iron-sulfur cluster repair di-iron protein [unclassified Sporosarcina]|uniref:iron-sulfur cluster repair di-iron protein n=1 Tax=unclassified Sporosarcina TaxID=2647733 RepID=UPI002041BD45|nr:MULTISPECIES: iron-sulfur cluster repair di-iron protein [unclassified Sporosarcina]GKV67162.1 iron-sulfur cluster repair di-iron protein [Sporosarcina sp. NCCP-2331]GLB57498.1 iron-sulfur cluster repair di-iron protein [Sporosarcina sp. NCCP-2378]
MSQITLDLNVSEIVTMLPQSADLFRNLRIDYCCGGKISLKEAAEQRELDPHNVLTDVHEIEKKKELHQQMEPSDFGDKTLVAYIQEKYHAGLREELPLLAPYVTKVARVHGDTQPHLLRIQEIFKLLRAELIDHTDNEDQNVFPLILEFLENPTAELKEQLKPHVTELETEHDNAGRLLHELREITNNFTPPKEACGTYRLVYARLEEFEKDTFTHVHLENNVLFERVQKAM